MPTGDEQPNVSITLASYEQGIEAYLRDKSPAPLAEYAAFLHRVLGLLPRGPTLLELGSGPGRDALFFEANGVEVHRTDATPAFVERLRASGHRADVLEVTTEEFGEPFDVVLANAVLLHLTVSQFDDVLAKAARTVAAGGLLAFTIKEGDGDAWTTAKIGRPRYFTYWREPAIRTHLAAQDGTRW